MRSLIVGTLLLTSAALAQIGAPRIGYVADSRGDLHPLAGLAGSFVLESAVLRGVEGGAYSGMAGVWSAADRLILTDSEGRESGSWPIQTGPILVAFNSRLEPALIWSAGSRELMRFPKRTQDPTPDWAGEPIALAVRGPRLLALVEQEDALWLVESSLYDGSVVSARLLPAAAAPAWIGSDASVVYSTRGGIAAADANGNEQWRIEVDGVIALSQAGTRSLAVRAAHRLYLLSLDTGELLRLPGGAQGTGGAE